MDVSRRSFLLKALTTTVGGVMLPQIAQAGSDESGSERLLLDNSEESLSKKFPFNILQGPTNETTTQLAIDLPKRLQVHYELVELSTGRKLEAIPQGTASREFSAWRVDQVRFEGLHLGEDYVFKVVESKKNQIRDQRILRALDTRKKNARIAFASCMFEWSFFKDGMWKSLEKTKPDAIFLLGDNVYADFLSYFHSPKIMWLRYISTRRFVPLYHWPELVPAFATWDDHDYGANNANGHYKHKQHSLSAFKSFYAQRDIAGFFETGPGISSAFDLFGQRVVFLDGRYFRGLDSNFGKGLLGDDQLKWALGLIENSPYPLWLCLGSQFFGGYERGSDSYESAAPEEFDVLKRSLVRANQPIILLSGDVHFSEVMHLRRSEFGMDAVELTSSCMHSVPDPTLPKNPRRTEATTKENFMMADLSANPTIDITCIGRYESSRFQTGLTF